MKAMVDLLPCLRRGRILWILPALAFLVPAAGLQAAGRAAPPVVDPSAGQAEAAREAASRLLRGTGAELQAALGRGDVPGAIAACSEAAPKIAAELSLAEGWQLRRVSLKPRNSLLGTADAWEQAALLDFAERLAAGEAPAGIERAEIVEEPAGRALRYARPIPTQAMCLACHGPVDGLAPEIREALAARYPADRATGHQPGDLRGAVTVRMPLD